MGKRTLEGYKLSRILERLTGKRVSMSIITFNASVKEDGALRECSGKCSEALGSVENIGISIKVVSALL